MCASPDLAKERDPDCAFAICTSVLPLDQRDVFYFVRNLVNMGQLNKQCNIQAGTIWCVGIYCITLHSVNRRIRCRGATVTSDSLMGGKKAAYLR